MTMRLIVILASLLYEQHLVTAFYLPYGASYDTVLPNGDDYISSSISFAPTVLNFYGDQYSQLRVTTNNWILFTADGSDSFWNGGFPGAAYEAAIATHSADYGTGSTGTIFYRSITKDLTNEGQFNTVDKLLNVFDVPNTVSATWMFVLTYDRVPEWFTRFQNLVNSWQCIVVVSGTESYVIFKWEDMQASSGWGPVRVRI
ncbi:sushi, nidogen and EGF-like domain-containing protein 1 [Amphiura filiformis]|uniref:sushi, nidogen and EGF-like domain-containing protein 1 n=1 Tax=Amphiura filiformis TaxID=82378 RepID=UPI003B21BD45